MSKAKTKPAGPPEPPPVFAVPETPPSTEPERVAIRLAGITYLIWPDQLEAFKARLARKAKQEEKFGV